MNRLDSRTLLGPSSTDPELPILEDLPSLWQHPGVTHKHLAALVLEVFRKTAIDGKEIVSIEPDPPGIHTYSLLPWYRDKNLSIVRLSLLRLPIPKSCWI